MVCRFYRLLVFQQKSLKYWIRSASLTVEAKRDELAELFDKFNSVPFDDRVNRKATVADIRRGYLEDFIRKSNSSFAEQINTSTIEELLLPDSCKKYPYTDQSERLSSLLSVLDVIEICPVAFEIYERLKKEYGFRIRR